MKIVLFLISMLAPTVAGMTLFYREQTFSRTETIIFSFTLGTGLLSYYLFFLMVFNIPFSALSVTLFFLPFFVYGAYGAFRFKGIIERFHSPLRSPLSGLPTIHKCIFILLSLLVAWKLFFMLFMILSGPTAFWDAYTLWNFKAKTIFYQGAQGSAGEVFGGEYTHYPLHLPLMRAWVALVMGHWDDSFANLHSFVLFLCLLGTVYMTLQRYLRKTIALVLTSVMTCVPILTYNVISGYADMALGYYFLAAAIMLSSWHKTGNTRYLIFTGIIASTAMFTKNEGVAIVFPSLVITLLFNLFSARRPWRYVLTSAAVFLFSCLLILLWLKESGALSSILTISGLRGSPFVFHPEGLNPLAHHLFIFRNYNLFLAGLLLLLVVKGKGPVGAEARFFLLPAILSLCAILYVFLFTHNVEWLLNGTTINRAMLIVVPLFTVLAGFLLLPEGALCADAGEGA